MVKQTVIFKKRPAPKVVNLPNGRSFTSKWKRISRKQLLINMKVKKQRTIGPRRNNNDLSKSSSSRIQKNKSEKKIRKTKSGKRLGSNLIKAGFDLESKTIGSEFGKKINKQRN